MHSSMMRTARCSSCLSCHTQPPAMHALLPHMSPAMHAPALPCMPPPYHACPLPCMPPAMYAPLPCMPPHPAIHAPCHVCHPCHVCSPFILHAPTPLPYTPPCHAPPLWTETPVKALPSQTSFAGGNKI